MCECSEEDSACKKQCWSDYLPCVFHTKGTGISSLANNKSFVIHPAYHGQSATVVSSSTRNVISEEVSVFILSWNGGLWNSGWWNDHLNQGTCCFRPLIVKLHVELVSVYLLNILSLWISTLQLPQLEWIKPLPLSKFYYKILCF